MEGREKLIEILERAEDEYISGEVIAKELDISRAGVWKKIQLLSDDGYLIEGVKNKGYRISTDCDMLSVSGIKSRLNRECEVVLPGSVDSTNDYLKKIAMTGEKRNILAVAREQTKGKGRYNRNFYSEKDSGVFMSLLLTPKLKGKDSFLVTTNAGIAVTRAIEKLTGKVADIKWVNDIYLEGKKVCGILTEASVDFETQDLQNAVLGIGINIYPQKNLPKELVEIVGTVLEKGRRNFKNEIVAMVINEFFTLLEEEDQRKNLEEYKKKCFVIGKRISFEKDGREVFAKAIDINDSCELVLLLEDGQVETKGSGEIKISI